MRRSFPSLLSLAFCVFCVLSTAHAASWDFEDGTLQGWTVVSGKAGKQPVDKDDDRFGGNFNKQGKYFIGTYENLHDEAQVEYRSPEFTLTSGRISLLVGGGNHPGGEYIALCDADGKELVQSTGSNSETMRRYVWDVSQFKGQKVYLKIVDKVTGGWGHINVDDIHEMTPEDEAKIEADRKERQFAQQQWQADLMKPSGRKVYRGEELTDLAMPLGGIVAGNIAVCGDGSLRQWQIFNKVNSGCIVPGQFFGVRAQVGKKPAVARVLRSTPFENLPTVKETEFIGEFPIAEIRYKDPALPVNISMEAFSPFIPMNSKDSGIPGIYFVFHVKNPNREKATVSLLATLQNAVGYDGLSKIVGVKCDNYGGNEVDGGMKPGWDVNSVLMGNRDLGSKDRRDGWMALANLSDWSYVCQQYVRTDALWHDFSMTGSLENAPRYFEPSQKGRTWNSAISTGIDLNPGQEKSVVFIIAWHFPNLYADYDKNLAQYRLGHMYSNWFEEAGDVVQYMADNYPRLSKETRLFRDTLFDSNLPYWFNQRISAPASTLTSQVCLWIEDGGFHAFEGAGCCPMNCTHVWNYEQTLSCLFPDLERNMRHTDLKVQQEPSGAIRHRTVLPVTIARGNGPFVDGHLGTILKSYREYRLSADRKWLDEMWPNIKSAMDFVIRDWDPNADGVLVNEQWNTYDAAMYGPNTFIGTLYLAALRSAEEMAKVEGDSDSARYHSLFQSGSGLLDKALWNGEYYIHIDSKDKATEDWITQDWPTENPGANRPYGTGCHADQLLGQWWANILDLGYLLPKDRVDTTLDSIMKYDWRWDFKDFVQEPRVFAGDWDMGLLCCTWPKGGRPDNPILYCDEVWTGIEYEVAGLLIREGKIRDASQIVKSIGDRYNGVPRPPFKRNPWNEIECGEHYARAMSSWAMLLAAQGMSYCGPDGSLGFNPVMQPENHRSFFSTAEGWGTFAQRRTSRSQVDSLDLKYGKLALKKLTFTLPEGTRVKSVKVTLGKKALEFASTQAGPELTITLHEPITIQSSKLTVEMKW